MAVIEFSVPSKNVKKIRQRIGRAASSNRFGQEVDIIGESTSDIPGRRDQLLIGTFISDDSKEDDFIRFVTEDVKDVGVFR